MADREPPIEGYEAIGAALAELYGRDDAFSRFTLHRLSTRSEYPLPIDGFSGRVWAYRSQLAAWVDEERARARRATRTTTQLDLFHQLVLGPHDPQ